MKKNAMLKIAAVLMVAVLLTTCFISSTFAKYTAGTHNGGTNTGRVAKWGLTITATNNVALFKNAYTNALSAAAPTSDFIVAPGTSNSEDLGVTIKGQPEVAFQVVFDPEVTLSGWTLADNTTFYCPVKFNVGGTDITINDETNGIKAIEDAMAKAFLGNSAVRADDGTYTVKYDPNTDVFAGEGTKCSVTWTWDFPTTANDEIDNKDTQLGDKAAANVENAPKISISYKISAEQIASK